MKSRISIVIALAITSALNALETSSFIVTESIASQYDQFRLDKIDKKKSIHAWPTQGPILEKTKEGDEYGYVISRIFIHMSDLDKSFYIHSDDVRKFTNETLRGIEPEYGLLEITNDRMIQIQILEAENVMGTLSFDGDRELLSYTALVTQRSSGNSD